VVRNLGQKAMQGIADYVNKRQAFVYSGQAPDETITKLDRGDLLIKSFSDEETKALQQAITESGFQGPKVNFGLDLVRIGEIFGSKDLMGQGETITPLENLLQNIKSNNKALFAHAKRDKQSIDDLAKLATKFGLDEVAYKFLNRNPQKDPLPLPEEVLSGILAVVRLGKELDYGARQVLIQRDPDKKTEAFKRIARLGAITSNLAANVSGAVSEYARGLAVVRNISKIENFNLKNFSENIGQIIEGFDEKNIDVMEFNPEEIDLKMTHYLTLEQPNRIKYGDKGFIARTWDQAMEVYVNSLLTSPATHVVNMAGNGAFQMLSLVERGVAGGVGTVRQGVNVLRGRYQGLDNLTLEDRVNADEFIHEALGMFGSISDALLLAGKTFYTGESGDFASKIDLRNYKTIGKTSHIGEITENLKNGDVLGFGIDALGVAARLPGTFLATEDEFFKTITRGRVRRREASRRATTAMRNALRSGLSKGEAMQAYKDVFGEIMMKPPSDVVEMMDLEAKAMTFQTDLTGFQGDLARSISHPYLKPVFTFVKTPTNIVNQVWDRTFAAPFAVAKALRDGTGREFDEAMSKMATGWTLFGGMFALTMGMYGDDVIVNGSGPQELSARRRQEDKGVAPYSISIKDENGNYVNIPFSRLDPLSGILAISADMANVIKNMPEDEGSAKAIEQMMMAGVLATAQYAGNLPFLQGVSELFQAVGNPYGNVSDTINNLSKFAGKKVGDVAVNVGGSIEGRMSFGLGLLAREYIDLPFIGATSFSAAMKRQLDPVSRSSKLPEERFEVLLGGKYYGMDYDDMFLPIKGFLEAVQRGKARSPYFSQGLEPNLDYWGSLKNQGNNFFNPIRIQNEKYNLVDDEIVRLSIAGAGTISMHNRKINGVEMTSKEYNQYINIFNEVDINGNLPTDQGYDVNKTVLPYLERMIVVNPEYNMAEDLDKYETFMQPIIGKFSSHARNRMQSDINVGSDRLILLKNEQE
jgi:hypothetical protein